MINESPRSRSNVAIAVAVPDPRLRRLLLEALQAGSLPVVEENCETGTLDDLLASIERLRQFCFSA